MLSFCCKNNTSVASNLKKFVWVVSTNSNMFAPTDTEKAWEVSNTIFDHSFSTPIQSYFPSLPSFEHCNAILCSGFTKADGS